MSNSSAASQPPLENPVVLDLMSLYGTEVIGAVFSVALWGISCMQVFLYFLNYEKDHWSLKTFVICLWSLETAIEALTWCSLWPILIKKWGSLVALQTITPPVIHRTWLSYVLAFLVQMFFLYRIYRFTGGKSRLVMAGLMGAVLIASYQLVGISVYARATLRSLSHEPVAVFLKNHLFVSLEIANRAVSAFMDILITVWMTILLSRRRNTVFVGSNRMVYRLILMTINSGMWTAVFALIDFILIAWRSENTVFTLFEFPIGGLYANMGLANLNARRPLRGEQGSLVAQAELGGNSSSSRGTSSIPLRNMNRGAKPSRPEDPVAIRIETSINTRTDADHDSMDMPKTDHAGL